MKKIKSASKLTLDTQTIKGLTEPLLRNVAGGISGAYSCNPCTGGATVSLCVTYVQRTCAGV